MSFVACATFNNQSECRMIRRLSVYIGVIALVGCSGDDGADKKGKNGSDVVDSGSVAVPQFAPPPPQTEQSATVATVAPTATATATVTATPTTPAFVRARVMLGPSDRIESETPIPPGYSKPLPPDVVGMCYVRSGMGLRVLYRLQDGTLAMITLPSTTTVTTSTTSTERSVIEVGKLQPGEELPSESPVTPSSFVPEGAVARASIMSRNPADGSPRSVTVYRMADGRIVRYERDSEPSRDWPIVVAAVQKPDVEVGLPAEVTDGKIGGNGRYLLLSLGSLSKIAVFDVREAKVIKYVELGNEKSIVAAGLTRFVVVDPDSKSVRRIKLATGEEELRSTFDTSIEQVISVGMGAAAEGPVYMEARLSSTGRSSSSSRSSSRQFFAVDLNSMKSRPLTGYPSLSSSGNRMFVSAQGDVVGLGSDRSFRVRDGYLEAIPNLTNASSSVNNYSLEGDGFFANNKRYYFNGEVTPAVERTSAMLGSCYQPNLWYAATYAGSSRPLSVGFHIGSEAVPAAEIQVKVTENSSNTSSIENSFRLSYCPAEKTLTFLTRSPPGVSVKRFDLAAAVANTPLDFLAVESAPPGTFYWGRPLSYQLKVFSNRGGVKYRLESGPPGMKISPAGLLEWLPPPDAESTQSVIVAISDAKDKQILHSFKLVAAPLEVDLANPQAADDVAGYPMLSMRLPAPAADFAVGGSGRYLLALMKAAKQVAVLDVKERKLRKLIPVDTDDVLIAAGETRFIIHSGDKNIISRWSFATLERELTAIMNEQVKAIAMGCSSEGPVLCAAERNSELKPVFLNLSTLRPITLAYASDEQERFTDCNERLFASSDGRNYTSWDPDSGPMQLYSITFNGTNKAVVRRAHESVGIPMPSADGAVIYTPKGVTYPYAIRPFTNSTDLDWDNRRADRIRIPASTGTYYLGWAPPTSSSDPTGPVQLFVQGDELPILTLPGIAVPGPDSYVKDFPEPLGGKRFFVLPQSQAVISVPGNSNELKLYRFDPDALLASTSDDYFFVSSAPPPAIRPSSSFRYQIEVKSKKGGVKFKLEGGPTGMTVSPTGLVSWNVPPSATGEQAILVGLADAGGRELIHTFRLNVDKDFVPPGASSSGGATPAQPTTPAVASTAMPATTTPMPVAVVPPAEPQARATTIIKLPAALDDTCVGGGGRYLVGSIKTLRQVVIVDLVEKKVVKYVPVDDDQVSVAAGMTRFVVAMGTKNILSRFKLATGERELTQTYTGNTIQRIAMGSASEGPFLPVAGDRFGREAPQLYDLQTLKPMDVNYGQSHGFGRFGNNVRVSADGTVFGSWNSGSSPSGLNVAVISGKSMSFAYEHNSVGMVLPSPDGRVVYTSGGIFTTGAQRIGGEPANFSEGWKVPLPATSGPFYLTLFLPDSFRSKPGDARLTLHMQGETSPILTLTDVVMPLDPDPDGARSYESRMNIDRRLHLLPIAEAIVTIPTTMDQLIVQRFNLDEELAKSEVDYLFVSSLSPASIAAGTKLTYKVEAKSKRGGVKFRLEAGPTGMAITPDGVLTWQPTAAANGNEEVVIVGVSDSSGQEIFHTFKLLVGARASTPASGPRPVGATPQPLSTSTVRPSGTPTTIARPLPMSTATATTAPGAGPRTWTSNDGMFSIDAVLTGVVAGKVQLKKSDGTTLEVPLDKLSDADRAYIKARFP